jgi:hypothetical protein
MGQSRFFRRFILLPSFVGLACYNCVPVQDTETSSNGNLESLSGALDSDLARDDIKKSQSLPVVEAPSTEPSLLSSSTAYRDGINLASSAYSLSQSAVSSDDWSLIASRWQQAVEQLKQVNAKDQNYAIAQQKVVEYGRNANHATAQLKALQQSIATPVPPRTPAAPIIATLPVEPAINRSNDSPRIRIPVVRRLHGTPVVKVLFNGERSYEMILDTGASRTLITRQMADELGVVATERMVAATASENEVAFDLGQMRSMSIGAGTTGAGAIGEITLQNARVSIGDSIDIGLLGNDFLQGYDVTIRADTVELAAAE